MARSSQTKWAEQIIDNWLSGLMAVLDDDVRKTYASNIVEGLRPLVLRQGERSIEAALALERFVCASLLARTTTTNVHGSFSKERFDMAIKANEHASKMLTGITGAPPAQSKKPVIGIGSRLKALMEKTEGAAEEAIALTERRRREREEAPGSTS